MTVVGYWPFGLFFCDIWQVSDVAMCTSSIMHMCTISLDRYMSIRAPLKSRNRSRLAVALKIAAVWLISLTIASPLVFIGIYQPQDILNDDFECGIFNTYFLIYGSLAAFFAPLVIMLVTYSLTIRLLSRRARHLEQRAKEGMRRTMTRRRSSVQHRHFERSAVSGNTTTTTESSTENELESTVARKVRESGVHDSRSRSRSSDSDCLSSTNLTDDETKSCSSGSSRRFKKSLRRILLESELMYWRRNAGAKAAMAAAAAAAEEEMKADATTPAETGINAEASDEVVVETRRTSGSGTRVKAMAEARSGARAGARTGVRVESTGVLSTESRVGASVVESAEVKLETRRRYFQIRQSASDIIERFPVGPADVPHRQSPLLNRRAVPRVSHSLTVSEGNFLDIEEEEPTSKRIPPVEVPDSSASNVRIPVKMLACHRKLLYQKTSKPSLLAAKDEPAAKPAQSESKPEVLTIKGTTDISPLSDSSQTTTPNPSTETVSRKCFMKREYRRRFCSRQDQTIAKCRSEDNLAGKRRQQAAAEVRHQASLDSHPPTSGESMPASSNSSTDVMTPRRPLSTNRSDYNRSDESDITSDSTTHTTFRSLVRKHSTAIRIAQLLASKNDDRNHPSNSLSAVQTERKAVKVLGTMFLLFVVCWASFFCLNFAKGICTSCDINGVLFNWFLWLGYASSMLNPIIYTIFNKAFKHTFIRILTCSFCLARGTCNDRGRKGGDTGGRKSVGNCSVSDDVLARHRLSRAIESLTETNF